jgi:DNA gyrase subunit A
VAAASDGYGITFGLSPFVDPSTRSGRRYARPKKGSTMIGVHVVHGDETVIVASEKRRTLLCSVEEVSYLSGPGRGVQILKLAGDDRLIGMAVATSDRDALVVKTSLGGEQKIGPGRYEVTSRGGRGREVIKRGSLTGVVREAPSAPEPFDESEAGK